MIKHRLTPLQMALVSLGVLPSVLTRDVEELQRLDEKARAGRNLLAQGIDPAAVEEQAVLYGAGLGRLLPPPAKLMERLRATAPKREKYEMRPLAERKERRRKRKQRRNR